MEVTGSPTEKAILSWGLMVILSIHSFILHYLLHFRNRTTSEGVPSQYQFQTYMDTNIWTNRTLLWTNRFQHRIEQNSVEYQQSTEPKQSLSNEDSTRQQLVHRSEV